MESQVGFNGFSVVFIGVYKPPAAYARVDRRWEKVSWHLCFKPGEANGLGNLRYGLLTRSKLRRRACVSLNCQFLVHRLIIFQSKIIVFRVSYLYRARNLGGASAVARLAA